MITRGAALLTMLIAGLGIPAKQAAAQSARTTKFVVPGPPGGPLDALARVLAESIGKSQGTTVVVENRAGAGTAIATEAVSRAAPDGRTVLFMANAFVINPIVRALSYDPLKSFEPICYLASSPHVIAVNSASPIHTLSDLVEAARTSPGKLTMASIGPATSQHIAFETLRRMAGVELTFVPYAGGAPAVTDLIGGHVASTIIDYAVVGEHIKAGRLRPLAVASSVRLASLQGTPTVAESGFPGFVSEGFLGAVVPAKTPKEATSQLIASFASALNTPEVISRLAPLRLNPVGICGSDFAAYLRARHDNYTRVIGEAKIKAE